MLISSIYIITFNLFCYFNRDQRVGTVLFLDLDLVYVVIAVFGIPWRGMIMIFDLVKSMLKQNDGEGIT